MCVFNEFEYSREMYHGERWRTDPKLQTPMAALPVGHVFVNDFVIVSHPHFGSICVKVYRFYCKVYM